MHAGGSCHAAPEHQRGKANVPAFPYVGTPMPPFPPPGPAVQCAEASISTRGIRHAYLAKELRMG